MGVDGKEEEEESDWFLLALLSEELSFTWKDKHECGREWNAMKFQLDNITQ